MAGNEAAAAEARVPDELRAKVFEASELAWSLLPDVSRLAEARAEADAAIDQLLGMLDVTDDEQDAIRVAAGVSELDRRVLSLIEVLT